MNRTLSARLVIALIFVSLGLLGLFGAAILHEHHETWARFLDHLSAAMLVVGLIAVLEKLVAERELVRHLIDMLNLRESVHNAGIEAAYIGAGDSDYTTLLLRSRRITLLFNDAKKWITDKKIDLFRERLARTGFVTEVFLLDPDGSFVDELAIKTCSPGATPADEKSRIQSKIRETIVLLRSMHEEAGKKGGLEIRLLKGFPTYSLCMGDDSAIVTLYTTSALNTLRVPVFEIRRTGMGDVMRFFEDDIERLRSSQSTMLPV